ncbi:uncharacterized protein [Eurosta solidaginis]|uniref:uncharacterized protein n=1 Tax=Eurosta solidaginis TaxID=178769 RepID=UPI003530D01C
MAVRHSSEDLVNLSVQQLTCTICNEELTLENGCTTPCQHSFHRTCITRWLTENNACPLCRRSCETESLKSFNEQDPTTNLDTFLSQGAIPRREGEITRSRVNSNEVFSTRRTSNHGNWRGINRGGNNARTPQTSGQFFNQNVMHNMIEGTFREYEERASRQMREEITRAVADSLGSYFNNMSLNIPRNSNSVNNRVAPQNSSPPGNEVHFSGNQLNPRAERDNPPVSVAAKIVSGWK